VAAGGGRLNGLRAAALYDIHGNLPALEAVLAEVELSGADVVVVGGDVASGPLPAQTLDRLRALGPRVRFVRGNADRELADAYERWRAGALQADDEGAPSLEPTAAWAAPRLNASHRELLAGFSPSLRLDIDGLGEVLFCHATPRSDEEIITSATTDAYLEQALADEQAAVIVAGHVHVRLDRGVGAHRFVNPGSVGMPYEDQPGAYWALLGEEVELRRTSYDYAAAAEAIRASGYPDAEELINECLLEPVGAAEATRFFAELARKREPPLTGA
jgi:predicted phosphodiesterase